MFLNDYICSSVKTTLRSKQPDEVLCPAFSKESGKKEEKNYVLCSTFFQESGKKEKKLRDKATNNKYKAFAFNYYCGYLYEQTNYCIIYDINNNTIKSIPLHRIQSIYPIKQKYKPDNRLIEQLQMYCNDYDFEKELTVEV